MGKLGMAMKVVELGREAKGFAGADKGDIGRQAGRQAFTHGTDAGKEVTKTWLKTFEVIPRMICRGSQFILALIACGLYGNPMSKDTSPEWIFAVAISGTSALTAVVFIAVASLGALPYIGSKLKMCRVHRAFAWDLVISLVWLIAFGIFATTFLGKHSDEPYKGANITAMKTAVWVDLANFLLWLVSGLYGTLKVFLGDRVNTLTGKAGDKLFSRGQKGHDDVELGKV